MGVLHLRAWRQARHQGSMLHIGLSTEVTILILSALRTPAPGLSIPAAEAAAPPAYEAPRPPVCLGCREGGGSRLAACGIASAHPAHGRGARGRRGIAMLRVEDGEEGEGTC
eukprot:515196-Hanusia_phi.AAC.1